MIDQLHKHTVQLRAMRYQGVQLLILVPLGMLYLSGLLGMAWWPPPSLAAYETIIKITGKDGPAGGLIRVASALSGLAGLFMPWRWLRILLYFPGMVSLALILLSFVDVGQGFAVGTWAVGFICGCIALIGDHNG